MRFLAILLVLSLATGCGIFKKSNLDARNDDEDTYKQAYYDEVKRNGKLAAENLKALASAAEKTDLSFDAHVLLHQILNLMNRLDAAAETLVTNVKAYRASLSTATSTSLAEERQTVQDNLDAVLAIIGEIETKLSQNVLKKLNKDADGKVITEPAKWKVIYTEAAKLAENMSGMRNTYLLLVEDYNRIAQIRGNDLGTATPVSPLRRPIVRSRPSPIVSDASTGGRVIGYARDSQTGAGIANATVGFKHEIGDTEYFARAFSDATGRYQSPYLLPARYYVDITKDGLAVSRDGEIEITRGQDRQANFTLTESIPEGKFRIVMSWCNAYVAGSVKDVDSHLLIPGGAPMLYYPLRGQMHYGTHLDLDDVDYEGPETTTIHEVKRGKYSFFVNNFSNRHQRDALGKSEIRVEVYSAAGKIKDYRIPQGSGMSYHVFNIVDGQVQDVKRFTDEIR